MNQIIHATRYSLDALRSAYRGESAFRQEFWLAAALLPAAFWLGRSWVEVALLAGSVMLVLIVELLNSGIEAAIDRVSFELHDLSKRAKNFGKRVPEALWNSNHCMSTIAVCVRPSHIAVQ